MSRKLRIPSQAAFLYQIERVNHRVDMANMMVLSVPCGDVACAQSKKVITNNEREAG
jgi:hypothetical protein